MEILPILFYCFREREREEKKNQASIYSPFINFQNININKASYVNNSVGKPHYLLATLGPFKANFEASPQLRLTPREL